MRSSFYYRSSNNPFLYRDVWPSHMWQDRKMPPNGFGFTISPIVCLTLRFLSFNLAIKSDFDFICYSVFPTYLIIFQEEFFH